MTKSSNLSRTVMRRVHTIHFVRLAAAPVMAVLVSIFALWGIGREVWVAKVFENVRALADSGAMVRYVTSAFIHTDLTVQILSILVVASIVWLASELAHLLKRGTRFAQ